MNSPILFKVALVLECFLHFITFFPLEKREKNYHETFIDVLLYQYAFIEKCSDEPNRAI